MNKNKQLTINLKIFLIMFLVLTVLVCILIWFIINKIKNQSTTLPKSISETVSIETYNNNDYFIINNDYLGEYDLQYTLLSEYFNSDSNIEEQFEKTLL